MKNRIWISVLLMALFFSGCVVYSFYPLYTKDDLFPNELLTGEWFQDDDGSSWSFQHPNIGKKELGVIDSTSYFLVVTDKDSLISKFDVNIVKLGGHYFLDFYLDDFLGNSELTLADFHIVPVHTFAKLTVKKDTLHINWFDQDWLENLIEKNKIRIHHENNGDYILLTAKPHELQKFVTKYVNSEEAFKDGMDAVLIRK
ncbi:MAG TPA: hypothetical protein VKA38_14995 [Draconibacterium sp.]|nr:hypothetical protein [Draconibacterium sp.]